MKSRALQSSFFNEFTSGKYKSIVNIVKSDPTLTMFLRGDYVTIYYKSLQILQITEKGKYKVDKEYKIEQPTETTDWKEYFREAKEKIDAHNSSKGMEKLEKAVQQAIVQENNCGSLCNETDYFIIDIEYTQTDFDGRFDAVAVYWPKNTRKNGEGLQLAFVEIKAGQNAISGTSGVSEHWKSVVKFIGQLDETNEKEAFLSDMEKMIEQLRELGLWDIEHNKHEIKFSRTKKPQLIFILVNYNPNSTALDKEIAEIEKAINDNNNVPFETLFATSSFMGYGLYDKCMLTLECVKKRPVKD